MENIEKQTWCKTFTLFDYSFEMLLNGTTIKLLEGKYIDNWTWEAFVTPNGFSLEVTKSIELSFEFKKDDHFVFTFQGRNGDWTDENNPDESIELTFNLGKWSIEIND